MSQPDPMSFFLEGPRYTWRQSGKDPETKKRTNTTREGRCPAPKGNAMEARIVHGKGFATVYHPKRVMAAEKALTEALEPLAPPVPFGPVRMDVAFVFVPPAKPAWKREACLAGFVQCDGASLGDRDNLHKLLADAMEAAGFFANDATITQGDVRKEWGPVPGYRIRLIPLQSVSSFAEWKEISS